MKLCFDYHLSTEAFLSTTTGYEQPLPKYYSYSTKCCLCQYEDFLQL